MCVSVLLPLIFMGCMLHSSSAREDVWLNVHCNEEFHPQYCDGDDLSRVEDFDRCGPARIPILESRNYFLAGAGRRATYKDNKDAYDRIRIQPKMLRDVSDNSIKTTVLGLDIDSPLGHSPVALHKLVHPLGEKATITGLSSMKTVMILSSLATTTIEDAAAIAASNGGNVHLWMQVYIFSNISTTIDLIRRAEKNGFKAIVLTSDSPVESETTCNSRARSKFPPDITPQNVDFLNFAFSPYVTFADITWLTSITYLPIVSKGLLSANDAVQAARAGASAILVSNHGGRQMDGDPATIDALPAVADAIRKYHPNVEVYMDGGIRSGHDVYKAIARGARMVLVGRPVIWGLAVAGSEGVKHIMTTLKTEFNETMLLAGYTRVADIERDTLIPPVPPYYTNNRGRGYPQ